MAFANLKQNKGDFQGKTYLSFWGFAKVIASMALFNWNFPESDPGGWCLFNSCSSNLSRISAKNYSFRGDSHAHGALSHLHLVYRENSALMSSLAHKASPMFSWPCRELLFSVAVLHKGKFPCPRTLHTHRHTQIIKLLSCPFVHVLANLRTNLAKGATAEEGAKRG